jgi:aminoglycoside phosphotransferase (APT) family kinase protein
VRIQPTGFAVFPEYDMRLQYDCMRLLAPTGVPVPRMYWLETEDTSVVGAPFYVMGRIEGRVPSDRPPYPADGWVKELAPADQARIWWGGIESMAKIHTLDWRALGFGFVDKPELGRHRPRAADGVLRALPALAARGKPQPTVEAAWEWLNKHKPVDEPDSLVWGDARIGNIIFEPNGTRPVAVLDWEMVTHGNGEEDLAWAIFLDRHHTEGIGAPKLPGFPSYDDTIARYEELVGRPVRWQKFYTVFAGFRFAVIEPHRAAVVHYGSCPRIPRSRPTTRLRRCSRRSSGSPAGVDMGETHRHFVPAAGADWFCPHDPFTRLMGTGRRSRWSSRRRSPRASACSTWLRHGRDDARGEARVSGHRDRRARPRSEGAGARAPQGRARGARDRIPAGLRRRAAVPGRAFRPRAVLVHVPPPRERAEAGGAARSATRAAARRPAPPARLRRRGPRNRRLPRGSCTARRACARTPRTDSPR